jgi:hypothetical protein
MTGQLAAMLELAGSEELLGQLEDGGVPIGQTVRMIADSGHPAAAQVLEALGNGHPDKKSAKAIRKELFKLRSRGPSHGQR